MRTIDCDFLVAGSGIAGLLSAIHLAPHGRVLLITKKNSAESSSNYAQGGIACVMEPGDSFEQHVADTLDAGAGLCDEAVVRRIVEDAPARIRELERFGVHFNTAPESPSGYDLGREGGHSRRRVLHSGDITGQQVETALLQQAQQTPDIRILEHARLIDLVTTARLGIAGTNRCIGAYALGPGTRASSRSAPGSPSWRPAAAAKSTSTRAIPTSPPATAWRSAGARARPSPTWSSSSSTPPASTIRRPRTS